MNWRYLPWVFPRQATRPTWFGTSPSRFPPYSPGNFTPRVKAREIAGLLRQSVPPRPRGIPRGGSQARTAHTHLPALQSRYPHPSPTGRPPTAAGVGAEGVGAGVTTPPYQRPRAAGAFDSFVPERWGPPASVGCRLQAFNPAWAAFTDDGYVLYRAKRPGSRALGAPTRRRRPHAHPRMPPHVRAGMTAEITALLNKGVIEPTADHPRLCLSPVFLV